MYTRLTADVLPHGIIKHSRKKRIMVESHACNFHWIHYKVFKHQVANNSSGVLDTTAVGVIWRHLINFFYYSGTSLNFDIRPVFTISHRLSVETCTCVPGLCPRRVLLIYTALILRATLRSHAAVARWDLRTRAYRVLSNYRSRFKWLITVIKVLVTW